MASPSSVLHQHTFWYESNRGSSSGSDFGHSEGEGNFALFIGTKLWVEEGCFRKVRTQIGGSFGRASSSDAPSSLPASTDTNSDSNTASSATLPAKAGTYFASALLLETPRIIILPVIEALTLLHAISSDHHSRHHSIQRLVHRHRSLRHKIVIFHCRYFEVFIIPPVIERIITEISAHPTRIRDDLIIEYTEILFFYSISYPAKHRT